MKQKKRILIVSSSFYPKNSPTSFRTTELVKEFSREGHNGTHLIEKHLVPGNDKTLRLLDPWQIEENRSILESAYSENVLIKGLKSIEG